MPSIVKIVTEPNIPVTNNKPMILFFAAGYMRIGINGSHGPRTKIVNKTQGVILLSCLP